MNAYSILIVNDHIEQLRREANERRMFQSESPAFGRRIATALSTFRTAMTAPTSMVNPIIPRLDGYPYRG